MKIAIIGATGNAGSAIFKEALKRGHQVTGYVRHPDKGVGILPPDAELIQQDAFTLTHNELQNYDVVVDAFGTTVDQAYLHIDLADHLIHELRETTSPRIVFILGAGSLETDGGRLYDLLKKDPTLLPSSTRLRISSENISCCNGLTTLTGWVFHQV